MRKLILIAVLAALITLGAQAALAESTVQIFFVACENQAVINLTGSMDAGFDVYYQVFSGAGASGAALTSLRQVQVNGQYAVSEQIAYTSGATVPAGSVASVRVSIAREGSPNRTTYTTTVDDIQDGCANPQNPTTSSVDAGAGAITTTTAGGTIRSPFGGFINPNVAATPEPIVVIGARTVLVEGRSATPGVIFAECDNFLPQAAPGLLYDNDNIVIFWSWFARTAQQVEDHLAQAQYEVSLNTAPLINVQVSPAQKIGTNFWVFYTANIGRLKPGRYGVEFKLSWKQAISDGYDEFGPDTDNPTQNSTCTFEIKQNPDGERITDYNLIYSVRN